jgi:hypothetical protein
MNKIEICRRILKEDNLESVILVEWIENSKSLIASMKKITKENVCNILPISAGEVVNFYDEKVVFL